MNLCLAGCFPEFPRACEEGNRGFYFFLEPAFRFGLFGEVFGQARFGAFVLRDLLFVFLDCGGVAGCHDEVE
ncbi:MAG: hypothetical protein AAF755_09790 [Pseudomonadota bacterium]